MNLHSNIMINVEPPGKKLQNINLMSGGEKVLISNCLIVCYIKDEAYPFLYFR